VLTYLCTGRLPNGRGRPPHDYGVVLLLLRLLPDLVPPDQVEAARAAVLTFLDASTVAGVDPERAAELADEARAQAAELPDPARALLRLVNERDTAALGRRLLPHVEALGDPPPLSPVQSPATHAPVFLLHGEDDNVIPSTETPLLARYLERQGNTRVRWLLTPLLSHADVQVQRPADAWRLIAFWTDVFDEGESEMWSLPRWAPWSRQ
jgi:acetyl esterase/lipase